jgi:hypothetical protein
MLRKMNLKALKLKLANFSIVCDKFNISAQGPQKSIFYTFSNIVRFNEPDNEHIMFQHVTYELLRHKNLQRRAKKGFAGFGF